MFRSSLGLCAVLLLATTSSAQCQVTRPAHPPFVPPSAYAFKIPNPSFFPYGTDELWTELEVDGKWVAFGKDSDAWVYQNKLTFWHRGFDWRKDEPKLTVTAKRLDGEAPAVTTPHANAVFIPNKEAAGMMTLIAIPTLGCWQITARYQDDELTYVVSVEPEPTSMTSEELELYGDFLDSFLGPGGHLTRASLAESTVHLNLENGDKDDCLQGIGFKVSEAANRPSHEFPASITKGRALYLVDASKVGPTDRQTGVLSLSEIGFDDDHRSAVFTWKLVQAGASGLFYMQGGTLAFRKTDGKWARNTQACLGWIT
jgi:hypothetical protein